MVFYKCGRFIPKTIVDKMTKDLSVKVFACFSVWRDEEPKWGQRSRDERKQFGRNRLTITWQLQVSLHRLFRFLMIGFGHVIPYLGKGYIFLYGHNVQIQTDPPSLPSICTYARRNYVHLGWENNMFQLSSLNLANCHLQCILYSLVKNRVDLKTETDHNCSKREIQRKMGIFQVYVLFLPCNLHIQHFSTHPPTLFSTLCKLENPYTKLDHP